MPRPTPQRVREHILKKLAQESFSISQLGHSLEPLGITHGYDTAYRQTMNLKRDKLIELYGANHYRLTQEGRKKLQAFEEKQ